MRHQFTHGRYVQARGNPHAGGGGVHRLRRRSSVRFDGGGPSRVRRVHAATEDRAPDNVVTNRTSTTRDALHLVLAVVLLPPTMLLLEEELIPVLSTEHNDG